MKKNTGLLRGGQKKRHAAVWFMALLITFCTGCGASSGGTAGDMMMTENNSGNLSYDMGGSVHGEGGEAETGTASPDAGVEDGRKLIETVKLEVETREFGEMMSALETQVQNLGGYIESMDSYNGSSYSDSDGRKNASLTIRLPSTETDNFLETVAEAGNIVRRNDTVEDVTLSYVDMEGRRDTLRTEQSRLLAFLDKAETLEDIITLEERLSEVRYQLESMESKLRTMDNLIEYSTVIINISEVQELTPVENPTAWERITNGFADSVGSIVHGVQELLIWILVRIPYLAIWGILIAVVVRLIRKHSKKKKEKLEELLRRTAPVTEPAFGEGMQQKEERPSDEMSER